MNTRVIWNGDCLDAAIGSTGRLAIVSQEETFLGWLDQENKGSPLRLPGGLKVAFSQSGELFAVLRRVLGDTEVTVYFLGTDSRTRKQVVLRERVKGHVGPAWRFPTGRISLGGCPFLGEACFLPNGGRAIAGKNYSVFLCADPYDSHGSRTGVIVHVPHEDKYSEVHASFPSLSGSKRYGSNELLGRKGYAWGSGSDGSAVVSREQLVSENYVAYHVDHCTELEAIKLMKGVIGKQDTEGLVRFAYQLKGPGTHGSLLGLWDCPDVQGLHWCDPSGAVLQKGAVPQGGRIVSMAYVGGQPYAVSVSPVTADLLTFTP